MSENTPPGDLGSAVASALKSEKTRRQMLLGALGLVGATTLGALSCNFPENDPSPSPPIAPPTALSSPTSLPTLEPTVAPTQQEKDAPFFFQDVPNDAIVGYRVKDVERDFFDTLVRVGKAEKFDIQYLKSLITTIENNKGTIEQRMETLSFNLCRIGTINGSSTALMIDDSGIFIAAGHTMGGLPGKDFAPLEHGMNSITQPGNDKTPTKTYIIYDYVLVEGIDMAIIYAPTGKPRKPTNYIKIGVSEPAMGENLWAWSMIQEDETQPRTYYHGVIDGQYADINEIKEKQPYKNLARVDKMIPAGGFSGGPIVNRKGEIVGIVSGAVPSSAMERKDYTGTRMTKISSLKELADRANNSTHSITKL